MFDLNKEIRFLRICEANNNIAAFTEAILDLDNCKIKQSVKIQLENTINYYKCSHEESYFKKLGINKKYEESFIIYIEDQKFYFIYDEILMQRADLLLFNHNNNLKNSKKLLFIKLLLILLPIILTLIEYFIFHIFNIYEIGLKLMIAFLLVILLDPFEQVKILIKK